MPSTLTILLLLTVLLVVLPTETYAFGAGDIPDFAYLNEKAFRHGDIESILANLAKVAGNSHHGGGLLGFASSVLSQAAGGQKFNKMDVKRVYFGNWLRDYSQAMDIAGLSKMSANTLVMIVSILGFMTFGFATEEFQVTEDRLGVYLPVEHIDNPKGYAEKEGDARQFHPKLRPPVNPEELEIDERTGMKNYMASENRGWDTSTAHVRRVFVECIEYGRRARGQEDADLWEAYRLLGTGLHTMEDLLAHSNWCEIALRKMGHEEVFCHVGDEVIINTPNGSAPPLVTGTFGSADFIHSLMGEATDHISEASVTNLYDKMNNAGDSNSSIDNLKNILSKIPIGGGSDHAQEAEDIKSKVIDFNPDDVAPEEVQRQLLEILKWRDSVYRDIIKNIEMIPGLSELIDGLTEALNAYVYTILAPWLTPLLQQATGVLGEGSKAVIDTEDQYEVFDNPQASDPSHSLLSKDHFGLILNEPAGKIAQLVVEYSVNLIVNAWFDDQDPNQVVNQILEAFHHPYYASGNSQIQNTMMDAMERWFGGLGGDEGRQTIEALTKESVRNGKNKRFSGEDESGGGATQHSHPSQAQGYGQSQSYGASGHTETQGYGGRTQSQSQPQSHGNYGQSQGYGQSHGEYGRSESGYGSGQSQGRYGQSQAQAGYGQSEGGYGNSYQGSESNRRQEGYGGGGDGGRTNWESGTDRYRGESGSHNEYSGGDQYSRRADDNGGGYSGADYNTDYHSGRREDDNSYERSEEEPHRESRHHGRHHQEAERPSYDADEGTGRGGYRPSYEPPREEPAYGRSERHRNNEESYGGSRRDDNESYGNAGYGGGYGDDRRAGGYEEDGRQYDDNGNSETFGVERLNLREESGNGNRRRREDEYY